MSMRSVLLVGLLACFATMVQADDKPRLGVPVDETAIAASNFTILPNGEGLPAGGGDATEGEPVYVRACLACHGVKGQEGMNDALVGGHGTLTGDLPVRTVGSYWPYATTLFDYIRRAMPYTAPGSLADNDVYALTAYILFLNGIVAEEDTMTAETLPDVRMPNRDNFVWAYTPR